jgi:hypothetical protein
MTQDDMIDLRTFLYSRQDNLWIRFGPIEAYVRKGHHMIEGQLARTFDLANFENHSKRKGKGQFRRLLPRLKKELASHPQAKDIDYIFVESVLNERLAASLPSMGFRPIKKSFPPCFYMPLRSKL